MAKEIVVPSNVHPYREVSHAIKAGNTIYISGQVGIGTDGTVVSGGFEKQASQALENLKGVVEAVGASLNDVVKLNIYVTSMESLPRWMELRRSYFGDHCPTATIVQVVALGHPKLMVEIEAIAVAE